MFSCIHVNLITSHTIFIREDSMKKLFALPVAVTAALFVLPACPNERQSATQALTLQVGSVIHGETIAMRVHEVKDKTVVVNFESSAGGKDST